MRGGQFFLLCHREHSLFPILLLESELVGYWNPELLGDGVIIIYVKYENKKNRLIPATNGKGNEVNQVWYIHTKCEIGIGVGG